MSSELPAPPDELDHWRAEVARACRALAVEGLVSDILENAYERIQHERLAGSAEAFDRLGGGGEERSWAGARTHCHAGGHSCPGRHAATTGGHGAREELRELTGSLEEQQAMAVLLLVSRYVAHAHLANALALTSPVP